MTVPYTGADYDLNMGTHDINTYGAIRIGPFRADYNGTHFRLGVP
jgi:hypothetical protein